MTFLMDTFIKQITLKIERPSLLLCIFYVEKPDFLINFCITIIRNCHSVTSQKKNSLHYHQNLVKLSSSLKFIVLKYKSSTRLPSDNKKQLNTINVMINFFIAHLIFTLINFFLTTNSLNSLL